MKKKLRLAASIVIILLTIAEFAYYLSKHVYLLRHLAHTPPSELISILILYGVMLSALVLIMQASLHLCRITMKYQDNLLLNIYSLFVNFFFIGQAGPGLRGAYLKKYYGLVVKKYIFVTLLYYVFYAAISALLLLAGSTAPLWLTMLATVLIGALSFGVVSFYIRRRKLRNDGLDLNISGLTYLLLVTFIQALIQICIYYVELHSVNGHITLKQTLAYTGVANFALFVGLTPGAIGIRESFLVFSERLHHISSANIVAANVIDRSVYLVFLGILFVVIISTHIKRKFLVD